MFSDTPFDRPSIPSCGQTTQTTYLVRSLVTGYIYFPTTFAGERFICAAPSPFDAPGFPTRAKAAAFAQILEKEKAKDICIGRPPYTRIEVRTDRIEIIAESDDSSSSEV